MQVTGVFHHLAAQAFALLFGLVQALVRLTHLGADQAAAVDRDVQLQADAGLLDIATDGPAEVGVAEAQVVIVAFLVLRYRIHGRCMPGLALAQGFFGSIDGMVGRQQVEVLFAGGFYPGLGVVGDWYLHRQGVDDALYRVVIAVGEGDQRFKGVVDLALGDDAVGPCRVVAGLGLEHVGLVGKAHVETFIGLVKLALEGRFFGLGRGQGVLGAQHGEVVFRSLQDQVLFGGRQLQGRLFVDSLGGLQLEPAIGTKDRLGQGRLPGIAAAVGGNRRAVELGTGVQHIGTGRQVRQQAGAGLRYHFLACAIVGAGCGEVGVVVHSFLVDADQVGLCRQGHICCPGHSVGSTRHGKGQ
ncbi:hypothetical protein D3C77_450590 [compost metagenome]